MVASAKAPDLEEGRARSLSSGARSASRAARAGEALRLRALLELSITAPTAYDRIRQHCKVCIEALRSMVLLQPGAVRAGEALRLRAFFVLSITARTARIAQELRINQHWKHCKTTTSFYDAASLVRSPRPPPGAAHAFQ